MFKLASGALIAALLVSLPAAAQAADTHHKKHHVRKGQQRYSPLLPMAHAGLTGQRGKQTMLLTIAAILFILWLLGFSFHVGGSIIHALLVIALIVAIFHFVTGRRVA